MWVVRGQNFVDEVSSGGDERMLFVKSAPLIIGSILLYSPL
jgi:hypothetical protein